MEMRNVNEQENIYEDYIVDPQIPRRPEIKRENSQNKWIIAATLVGVFIIAAVAFLATVGYTQVQQLHDETSRLRESLANSQQQHTKAIGNVSSYMMNQLHDETSRVRDRMAGLGQKLNNAIRKLSEKMKTSISPHNCNVVFDNGYTTSGIYTINIGGKATQVYCDMETDGGGWIIFQRRFDGSVDFYRNWTSYQQGFGSLNGEFWLGLDLLHQLTTGASYKLRVDLEDAENNTAYAEYRIFTVGKESSNYTLTVGGCSGTAGKIRPITECRINQSSLL
ncbi:uncharacterized protein LOC143453184 [Clavelina lepadiformis]|uniref:uncharacterized protein LOC143453184 n=1 Tax=Clavelina lepadiformis TaxID=159417 RepID=UPI004041A5A9